MTRLAFLDTETTSLRPDRRAWEIGLIVRDERWPGREDSLSWFIDREDLDLGNADERALDVGRFYQRHSQFGAGAGVAHREREVLEVVERMTRGAVVVGAVPWFDTDVLDQRMRWHGILPSWHYALVDVKALAAGAKKLPPPWRLDDCLAAFGLTYDEADRHTALGDARMVARLYDAVMAA